MRGGEHTITINKHKYTILEQISYGMTGAVYKIQESETKEFYALKVIEKSWHVIPIIQNEVAILNFLKRHCSEFILCIKESNFDTDDNYIYIVTEFLGTDLLTQSSTINPKNYLLIIHLLCKALVKLHQLGIAHRDIKLENIMLTESKKIKIIDFGHSIIERDYKAHNYEVAGTALYFYPVLNKIYEPTFELLQKSDVWSLGIAIFMLLLKKIPYTICNKAETDDDIAIQKYMTKFMEFAANPTESDESCNYTEFEKIMIQADALFEEGQTQGLYTINLREILTGKPENQKIYVPSTAPIDPLPVTAETYTP